MISCRHVCHDPSERVPFDLPRQQLTGGPTIYHHPIKKKLKRASIVVSADREVVLGCDMERKLKIGSPIQGKILKQSPSLLAWLAVESITPNGKCRGKCVAANPCDVELEHGRYSVKCITDVASGCSKQSPRSKQPSLEVGILDQCSALNRRFYPENEQACH